MSALQQVQIGDDRFFKITNSDQLRPFFMSIVSDSNHWMFIASNGGLTAGRKNADYALFPYYTDDKITESAEITGSKSIFQVHQGGKTVVWEPFSIRQQGLYQTTRNLYKHQYGNQIIFEEVNHDLELTFRYRWSSSNRYGFVRTATLEYFGQEKLSICLLDGLQNIMPYGVGSELQNRYSNLVDAYKRSELHAASGLGIFALSAIIVDKAEPSEALKANVVWSLGLDRPSYLLSSLQLDAFRQGEKVQQEEDVKGEKGAYFVQAELDLAPGASHSWTMVANVNQNHANIVDLIHELNSPEQLLENLSADVLQGTQRLVALCAAADGLQRTADHLRDTRHYNNVLFNIMRGGIFDHNYQIEKWDFSTYLAQANRAVAQAHEDFLAQLPDTFSLQHLQQALAQKPEPDLRRLATEYLPLKFSRRHGDPSRPWNRFSINTQSEVDGSKILDYEGNWRDIFQNWEALAYAYPAFLDGMIFKFLNASTFDGYNPYRVTKGGFDWETIEADDPWSYIGYWGDHQIIYLLKFLECSHKHQPGKLAEYFDQDLFVYANVPYKIKDYQTLLANPKDTIDFDHELDQQVRELREEIGADGALLRGASGDIYRVNFIEKILATVLAKLSNFIPEAGIWMNTQRPEWNDANNALVGNGVSMVTLYYLRRFLTFFRTMLEDSAKDSFAVSAELVLLLEKAHQAFAQHQDWLQARINDQQRKHILDLLGEAAAAYRHSVYTHSFRGDKKQLSRQTLQDFLDLSLAFIDHSIAANRRDDGLYHAYNLVTVYEGGLAIDYLSEMLEGQVAVLSSGYLGAPEALAVLDGMKKSKLFREDQYSYLLYPNKELPGFLERNTIPAQAVATSKLLQQLVADKNKQIIEQDRNGAYHFNGNFKNAKDLDAALQALQGTPYAALAKQERQHILDIFEQVFNHKAFTGRSGTFYGYEGLGSIYWHMVSKLLLAVQENCLAAAEQGVSAQVLGRLREHYYEINAGIGVHKPPKLYGAFPTDPYSHTPAGKGAQQPGMTGQVKEDILSRIGELGVKVEEGKIHFSPTLLRRSEFLQSPATYTYVTLDGQTTELALATGSLAFTHCQVPVVYQLAELARIEVEFTDGRQVSFEGQALDQSTS
ncbi:MAG: hypothetical protein D6772_10745, partial [Bacteroidetes bacterium]